MTRLLVLLVLAGGGQAAWAGAMATGPRGGESARHKVVRRLIGAAACGLSAWDGAQSANHIGSAGIVEANPALSDHGRLLTGRMIGFKIGACAAPFVLGEWGAARRNRTLEELGLWTGAGSAALSGATVLRNHAVLERSP